MHGGNEIAHRPVRFQVMPQCDVTTNRVAVTPTVALPFDHPARLKISQYFQHCALRDAYFLSKVAHTE